MNRPIIEKKKQIQLFESPKAVLQMDTMYDNLNTSVAMFGMNLGKQRRDEILRANVEEVILGIDKDYETEDSKEFESYIERVEKIAKLFKGYARCSVLYDGGNLLGYKESPTDRGKEVYESLYNQRKVVNV